MCCIIEIDYLLFYSWMSVFESNKIIEFWVNSLDQNVSSCKSSFYNYVTFAVCWKFEPGTVEMINSENEITKDLGYMPDKYDCLYYDSFEDNVNTKNGKMQSEFKILI